MRFFNADVMRPADETEISRLIAEAAAERMPIEIRGNGSKRAIGRPLQVAGAIETGSIRGVTLYEPSELVMSAKAGTPLRDIEERLASRRQMLAFEPLDLGPLNRKPAGQATIGAVFAANLSGSRRLSAGAARDHLLGIRAVNGRGEVVKSGGRVMKNVTGYDLCRGIAGSWGTLAMLTEVTFKVVPQPQETRTLLLYGLLGEIAVEVMCAAMSSQAEVTGAMHVDAVFTPRIGLPRLSSQRRSVTALRLENFSSFLDARMKKLTELCKPYGQAIEIGDGESRELWSRLNRLSFLEGGSDPVWRISTAPAKGARVMAQIQHYMNARAAYDWSGGLLWVEVPPTADAGATDIRRIIASLGGHATLMRAEPQVRASVDVFQPLDPVAQALSRRLKEAFDPAGVLNPGRMYADF